MTYKQLPEVTTQIKKDNSKGWNHVNFLQHLVKVFDYESYLEIGVQKTSQCFDLIPCKIKTGIDPIFKMDAISENSYLFKMNSDTFFFITPIVSPNNSFDLIFIDGAHNRENVLRDFNNSLEHINKGGTIVIHDASPYSEEMTLIPRETQQWSGDVWKACVQIVTQSKCLVYTIDADLGVMMIHPDLPREQTSKGYTQSWDEFQRCKKEMLNLITVEEWHRKIKTMK